MYNNLYNNLIIIPLIAIALLIAGCGFQPLYAKRMNSNGDISTTDQLLAQVNVKVIANREGQILRNLLLDRLSPNLRNIPKTYNLTATISISKTGLGVQVNDTTTRSKLTVTANFLLESAKKSRSFSITQVSGYSDTLAQYPTLIAKKDAIQRSLREIANDAKIRIALFLEKDR